jgi:hypothetical protein
MVLSIFIILMVFFSWVSQFVKLDRSLLSLVVMFINLVNDGFVSSLNSGVSLVTFANDNSKASCMNRFKSWWLATHESFDNPCAITSCSLILPFSSVRWLSLCMMTARSFPIILAVLVLFSYGKNTVIINHSKHPVKSSLKWLRTMVYNDCILAVRE